MTIRFQADADLNEGIVSAVLRREPSIDFQTALEARLPGLDDPEVLAVAAAAGRILVSHDARTMPHHFGKFIVEHSSPGLLIVPQHLAIRRVVDHLHLIWFATESSEWVNRMSRLPL